MRASPRLILLLLAVLMVPVAPAVGGDRDDAWAYAERFPEDLGVVAVIESPAALLASEDGRAARLVLASTGVFSRTIDAWTALGAFLDADADEIVDLFFSDRVAIVIEQWGAQDGGLGGIAQRIDSEWALVSSVEHSDVKRINELLDPVPRRLVDGVPVYSIERGRFTLAVVPSAPEHTRVVLVPSGAARLAERLVGALKHPLGVAQDPTEIPDATRRPLVYLRALNPGSGTHTRIEIGKSDNAMELSFTTPVDPDAAALGQAPIELLDSQREDAIGLAVFASGLTLEGSGPFGLSLLETNETPHDPIVSPEGVCMVVHEHPGRTDAVEWTMLSSGDKGSLDALGADRWIERRYLSLDPKGGTGFGGILPETVRSDAIPIGRRGTEWALGPRAGSVSWRCVSTSRGNMLVHAFADDPARSSERVSRLADAAELADLLDETRLPGRDAVLTKGWADASALMGVVLSNAGPTLRPLSGFLGELSWDVRHDEGLARGRCLLTFSEPGDGFSWIGSDP